MARILLFLLTILLINSCSFFDKHEDTPAYIHIEKFQVNTNSSQGSNSDNITDAWIFVDGIAMGVFELPCTIPVLKDGNCQVIVYAGIKDDGISAIRKIYPFYTNYVETRFLTRGLVDTISPICTYFDTPLANINKEEFEDAGIKFVAAPTSVGNIVKTNTPGEVFEDQYSGKITLNSTDLLVKSIYNVNFLFPGNGAQAYAELDYMNNVEFTVGMEITEPQNIVNTDNTIITKSLNSDGNLIWKKIYINLTELVNLHPNATNYRVYIQAVNPESSNGLFVLIDNFKVVYAN